MNVHISRTLAVAAGLVACSGGESIEVNGLRVEIIDLVVPIDHADPDGPTTVLRAGHIAATGRDPIGPLVLNFGGPGAPAVSNMGVIASDHPELLERFDFVAIDPRLTSHDSPLVDCMPGITEVLDAGFDTVDEPGFDAQRAARGAWAADCADRAGPLAGHVGVRDLVEDHEILREELGGEPFTLIGFSWGTVFGQVYAEEHPEALRALFLDGVGRPGGAYVDFVTDQARGFQDSLEQWARWCERNECPLDDPAADVAALFDTLRTSPLPATGGDLTYGRAWHGVAGSLYGPGGWEALAEGVAAALDGEPDRLAGLADAFLGLTDDGGWSPGFAGYTLTECQDLVLPADDAALLDAVEAAVVESPLFGAGLVMEALTCTASGVPNDPIPFPVTAPGAPPIVLVGGAHDPATPLFVAEEVHATLAGSDLVTWSGSGHVAFRSSACVRDLAADFLIDLRSPGDVTCE